MSGHGGVGFLEPTGQFLIELLGDLGALIREVAEACEAMASRLAA